MPPDWSGKFSQSSFDKDEGFSEYLTELTRSGDRLIVAQTSTLNGQVQGSISQVYFFDRFYPESGRVRLYLPTQAEQRSYVHLDLRQQKLLYNEELCLFPFCTKGKQPPNPEHERVILTALWELTNLLVPDSRLFSPNWQLDWQWQQPVAEYGQLRTQGTRMVSIDLCFKTLRVEDGNRITCQWFHVVDLPIDFRFSAVVRGYDSQCQTEFCISVPYEYQPQVRNWAGDLSF